MKSLFIICAILSLQISSFAEETNSKVPVSDDFKPMHFEGMPAHVPASGNKKVTFSASCTDVHGRTLQQNQAGYEACLVQAQQKANNPDNNKPGSPTPGPGMNMNFNLGN